MKFFPHIAVEIPRNRNGLIAADKKSLAVFWSRVDIELEENLGNGVGCYILSIRAGQGSRPWYVGMAEKQSFRRECFTPHKLNHYNTATAAMKGTPLLTLIAKYTPSGRIVTPRAGGHRDVQFLESMLISTCIRRNPDLYNKRDTKLLREMMVPGLLNTPHGMTYASVAAFRDLVGV